MKSEEAERIILGIDPGTTVTGYGLIKVTGRNPSLITLGIIDLRKKEDHFKKIRTIFEQTLELIDHYHPDEFAIEAPFFGKNVQSMLKLGRAQGVAIAAALQRELAVTEYAPKRIKQSITGNGNASKEQVAAMLLSILGIARLPRSTDATDAVAVAVCHHFASQGLGISSGGRGGRSKDWSAFLRNHPDRVR